MHPIVQAICKMVEAADKDAGLPEAEINAMLQELGVVTRQDCRVMIAQALASGRIEKQWSYRLRRSTSVGESV